MPKQSAMPAYLESIKENFNQHYHVLSELAQLKLVYLDTSAFNYFLDNLPQETILNTRAYLLSQKKAWIASPITLWEVMLTKDDFDSDHLIFIAQNLFHSALMASPSEIVVRYLQYSYPHNKIDYSFLSNHSVGQIWMNMASDDRLKFVYDKEQLKKKTSCFWKVSKNLPKIIAREQTSDELVNCVTEMVHGVRSFLSDSSIKLPDDENIIKFVILYAMLLLVMRADFYTDEVHAFWDSKGLGEDSMAELISCLFLEYPEIFWKGPLLEMANMACHQYKSNRRDRGILLDGLHMVYAPYCDMIISGDPSFSQLRNENPIYWGRVFHTSEIQIKTVNLADDPRN